jgi:hypothetical protein
MMFVIDNQTKCCSGLDARGCNARNQKQLYVPNAIFLLFRRVLCLPPLNYLTDCPKPFKALKRIELVLK